MQSSDFIGYLSRVIIEWAGQGEEAPLRAPFGPVGVLGQPGKSGRLIAQA